MKQGSAPNFCPPIEEGIAFTFEDENGDLINLEFLGLIVKDEVRYGFFFPITDDQPALGSGEIIVLEVTDLDEEGQPSGFELVDDESICMDAYNEFKKATADLYDFE